MHRFSNTFVFFQYVYIQPWRLTNFAILKLNFRLLYVDNFGKNCDFIKKKFLFFVSGGQYCLKAVKNAVEYPYPEGLRRERELITQLMTSGQSKALRYAFFCERNVAKVVTA